MHVDVTIRTFARLRDLLGDPVVEHFEGDAITVAELRDRLGERPELGELLPALAVAINHEYCQDLAAPIREGDEVALIQPISGGSGTSHFLVTEATLDRDALRDLVRTDASGAVVLFEGIVRNHHEGHDVDYLEYEAYGEMAVVQLEATGREVLEEFADREVHDLAAHHRVGRIEIGEVSLLVAVSASHRRDAFEAALHAVDRIKETVPVWKREYGPNGAVWQEGVTPRPSGAAEPASS